ncbi:MAG: ATP-dependent DNA ligase [Pedosphaera sp.]|nr:ATP-dependent DNA ligase [Pedosphaera sp.]
MSALAIRFHKGGIHLPGIGLWLDPHGSQKGQERVFISHAHSDHTGVHREVILTEPTSRLMRARLSGDWQEHLLPFGQRTEFPHSTTPFHVTLLPAGHIFGSAMALIEAGGESLLYTGDFKLRPGFSAEPCDPALARGVDSLVMETTYGRPAYRFPATDEVMRGVIRFCREALDNEETPVLLGYSLGKSQELLRALADAQFPLMLHGSVHKLTQVYESFGAKFPPYEKFEAELARGKVLIGPPAMANSTGLRKIARVRTAVLTGWAVDLQCRYRYQADAAFPLSDHADFPDLIEFVKQIAPKRILTLHGFAADFAQTLRDLGYDAQALSEEEQLALPLALGAVDFSTSIGSRQRALVAALAQESVSNRGSSAALSESKPSGPRLAEFSGICKEIGGTAKKLEKVAVLAGYFKSLDPAALAAVAPWFTGIAFAPIENRNLQVGWAVIRDALLAVSSLNGSEFGQIYLKHGDLGEAAVEIIGGSSVSSASMSVARLRDTFERLHSARGPSGKVPVLAQALHECTGLEAKYVIKILTGDLRIGLKEGLVEEALAHAFDTSVEAVRNTNLVLGNISETAVLASEKRLDSATLVPFRPIKFMLASPHDSVGEIWQRISQWSKTAGVETANSGAVLFPANEIEDALGSASVAWVEDKYDGIRCQLHKVGNRVALFSRDLKEITATFLEVADAIQINTSDFVLDGELIAAKGDEVLPFTELQKRLGRRESDLFLGDEIPVRFVAFDLLWQNGSSLLNQPLQVRRQALAALAPAGVTLAPVTRCTSANAIETSFSAARDRGNEGLMVKDPASLYTPGRRGLSWLKLKRAIASLDCVIVGAEYGHGKRKDVLSDYTFAVRDEVTGEFKTIGKAYIGLTDGEIAKLTKHLLNKVTSREGRYNTVEPDTILEIAFDVIQVSDRHSSGLAMRFPRIVRVREDKTLSEIDTLATARNLLKS